MNEQINNVPEVHIDIMVTFKSNNQHRYTVAASKLNTMAKIAKVASKIQQDMIEDEVYSDVFEQIPTPDGKPAVLKNQKK